MQQVDTVLVGRDIKLALEWCDRWQERDRSNSSGGMAREVGTMEVTLMQVGDKVELRYQDAVLGQLRMNRELLAQMEVNFG